MPEELKLHDYWRILRHRLWLVILIVAIGLGLAVGYNKFMQEPTYEASAKLVIRHSAEGSPGLSSEIDLIDANLRMIDTYKEFIRTPVVIEKVTLDYPELKLRPSELSGKIKINAGLNSQLMTVTAQDGSYEKAVQIVNAVSHVFLDQARRVFQVRNLDLLYEADPTPIEPPVPVGVNLKSLLVIAFIVSSMIGLALCVLLEYLDRTIKTDKDVQRVLQLPTLIELPLLLDRRGKHGGRHAGITQRLRTGESRDVPLEK